jgi:hypothetical protein
MKSVETLFTVYVQNYSQNEELTDRAVQPQVCQFRDQAFTGIEKGNYTSGVYLNK